MRPIVPSAPSAHANPPPRGRLAPGGVAGGGADRHDQALAARVADRPPGAGGEADPYPRRAARAQRGGLAAAAAATRERQRGAARRAAVDRAADAEADPAAPVHARPLVEDAEGRP